jgi:hypothetical protein
MIEAFTDPKTWLFALFAAVNNLSTSLSVQLQIIVVSFGFNPLQTTLLGSGMCIINCVDFHRRQDCVPHPKQHRMGRDCVFHSWPSRSVPGQLSTLARQSRIASFHLGNKYAWYSAKTPAPLILVISSLRHWLCVSFVLGVANDGWAYKESHNECHDAIWVLHWQCYWTVHVESKI